jgi:hypothetical protein
MKAKLTGLAWVMAMAAGLMVAGCQEPKAPAEGLAAAPQAEPTDPAVSVFGLGVKGGQYDEVLKLFRVGRELGISDRPSPALDVMLHVATEKYDLVRVERAVVESLTDEAGHDLSLGMTQTAERLFFPADTNISLDHKHGFIALHFPKPPAAETRRMSMRGTVLARGGGKPQTLTFEDVPFAVGSKFKVLGHDYRLDNISSYDSRPSEVNFTFTSDGSYDEVRGIRFLSPDGKKVVGKISRVDRNLREATRVLCQVTGEKPQAMRIEVDTYDNPVELAIPFQLTLDLGAANAGESVKLVTTATLPAAPAAEKIKSEAQVIALTLTPPLTEQQGKDWFGERSNVAFFRHAGINMQVKVHVPDRKMVRLISGPGMAYSFADDTGASLLATASLSGNADQSGMRDLSAISQDGHDVLVTVATGKLPATGAREVRFKGKIGVVMEDSEKVGAAKGVSLLPGTTFKAGDVEMTVTAVRAAGAAGNGMDLEMKADKEIRGTVVLLDEKGKQLASASFAEDRYRREKGSSTVMFTLPKAVDTATVQVKTANEADGVAVPVEFAVPIGLGGRN